MIPKILIFFLKKGYRFGTEGGRGHFGREKLQELSMVMRFSEIYQVDELAFISYMS